MLRHNEHFLIDAKDPIWPHYRTIWWYLLPHGMMGACALMLGPMQFSDRLRARFTKLHRVVGRFYVAGVLETIVWMCNVFSLLFADLILQLQELLRSHSAAARTLPATR